MAGKIYDVSSDSSMDDCNGAAFSPDGTLLAGSDSSMDDCNVGGVEGGGEGGRGFRFLYGRL